MEMNKELLEAVNKYLQPKQYFRAETVKGKKTIITIMGFDNPRQPRWVYFAHAGRDKRTDRAKVTKHTVGETIRAIEAGDIEPVARETIDPHDMGMLAIGLTALAKGMGVHEYLDRRTDGSLPPEGMK